MIIALGVSCTSKCPIANCRVRMQHRHAAFGEKVYNRMPWFKDQNPRTGKYYPDLVKDGSMIKGGPNEPHQVPRIKPHK